MFVHNKNSKDLVVDRETLVKMLKNLRAGNRNLCRASAFRARYAPFDLGEMYEGYCQVYFLLGHTDVAPHVQKELVAENATYKDLVLLNMTDSYRNLFQKSYKWFEHASAYTTCNYIFKTDDDGYEGSNVAGSCIELPESYRSR